jgi:hypothetical protein
MDEIGNEFQREIINVKKLLQIREERLNEKQFLVKPR